jgi:hypothetical protein
VVRGLSWSYIVRDVGEGSMLAVFARFVRKQSKRGDFVLDGVDVAVVERRIVGG